MLVKFLDLEGCGLNCIETCFINVANRFRNEYCLLYYRFFDFQFNQFIENRKLDKPKLPIHTISALDMEQMYSISAYEEWNLRDALHRIKYDLSRAYPIVLHINKRHCSWIKEQQNVFHFVLLTEITQNGFRCQQVNGIDHDLPMDKFIKGFDMILYFEIFELHKVDKIDEMKNHLRSINIMENLIQFHDFFNKWTEFEEGKYLDYVLSSIAARRSLYCEFLNSINLTAKCSELKKAGDEILLSRLNWLTLRNMMMRAQAQGYDGFKHNILQIVREIIKQERQIRINLLRI